MKKSLFLLILALLSFQGIAQKGNWYIGGTGGFNSSTDKAPSPGTSSQTISNWDFAPEVGTFLKDDIQLGAALRFGGGSTKNETTSLSSNSTVSPIVYARKFFTITDNLSTFAGLYLNYFSSTNKDEALGYEDKESGFGATMGVGIAYALSPKFTAVGQYGVLGFSSSSKTFNGNDNGSSSSFNFGVNTVGSGTVFNIGIYYTFVKK